MAIVLKDNENNTLYTFPLGFHLDRYRLSKRTKSVDKAYQHGGDVVGDGKYDLQHISLVGTLGAASIASFESVCTLMKQNVVKSNLRLYGAYKTDQYFDIKGLESADWDFLTDGGLADVEVRFLSDPFRYYQDVTISGPSDITATGQTVSVYNGGDLEVSPVILYTCDGTTQTTLKIMNINDSDKYFQYEGDLVDGDQLEIDCAEATVKKNTVDVIGSVGLTSTFYSLVTGTNVIKVDITGQVGLTNTIKHTFRKRYL